MFVHTNCPAVAISLESGAFDPDVKVSAKISADRKTLTISVPSPNGKLNTADWTVPVVGGRSKVNITLDTGAAPRVESALSLNLTFGPDAGLPATKAAAAKKSAVKKKAPAKVAPRKRK